jgi:hypothetical protein
MASKTLVSRPCLVCDGACQAELSEADNGVRVIRTIGEAWVILGGTMPGAPERRMVCSDECRKKLLANDRAMDQLAVL